MRFTITATTTAGLATGYGTDSQDEAMSIVRLYVQRGYTDILVNGRAFPA